MKKTIQLKNRAKAAIALLGIMCLVLLVNVAGRQNYSNLDRSISSIYKDRLMPATYIYEISDHLYQKRLLQEESVHAPTSGEMAVHDKAIASLIHDYEQTFLTTEEKKQWLDFKQQLAAYNALALNSSTASHLRFNGAMNRLHSLSRLQVGEGTELQKNAKAIISGSTIMSTFELSVLVILGFSAIILISKPEKLTPSKNYSLN